MNNDEPFLRAIVAAYPACDVARLVFADYLDEQGRTAEATGQRWAAKHGKQPGDPREGLFALGGWYGDDGHYPYKEEAPYAHLPTVFFLGNDLLDQRVASDDDLLACERGLLAACAVVSWADNGEPSGHDWLANATTLIRADL